MGKPFQAELKKIQATHDWACSAAIDNLKIFVANALDTPLIAVGSGGSLTVAQMAALLHRSAGSAALATTPLELVKSGDSLRQSSVLIITAGGNNKDIVSAFEFAALSEPRHLAVLCMRKKSRLSAAADKFRYVSFFGFDTPAGRDGFLATNSLLAAVIILIRAYQGLSGRWDALTAVNGSDEEIYRYLEERASLFSARNTWVTLFSGWGHPAAVDMESKLTEAAIGAVQLADYRNFAHGRHHWIAKRGAETVVAALVTPDEKEIADRTLSLLPQSLPVIRVVSKESGPAGGLELLTKVFHIVNWLGNMKGVDPGRPGVPLFGRRIYNLGFSIKHDLPWAAIGIPVREATAILRKAHCPSLHRLSSEELVMWRGHYHSFVRRLEETCFGSVILDYDGTLCDPVERYSGLSPEVGRQLTGLLDAGIVIGVATGRGGSVRDDLVRVIPETLRRRVVVGYYNGGDVGALDLPDPPNTQLAMNSQLQVVRRLLEQSPGLAAMASWKCRPRQISVQPKDAVSWSRTKLLLHDMAMKSGAEGIRVLESGHSIDVLAPHVSKTSLIEACRSVAARDGHPPGVLCIGDRGQWPGNDFDLLSTPYSISVDQVSSDPETCWNLSNPGHRGVQATMGYFGEMRADGGSLRLTAPRR